MGRGRLPRYVGASWHDEGVVFPYRCSGFLLTLIGVVVLAACASDPPAKAGNPSPGRGASTPAVIERVVDGDTVVANIGDERVRVRLLGIDTPESVVPEQPPECFGPEAADRARQLLPEGSSVRLVTDPRGEVRDDFDRLLAYVDRDGRSINEELVRSGHAQVFAFNDRRFERRSAFEAAERGAQRDGRGLWGACRP